MALVLVVLASVSGVAGLAFLSQATFGVGLMAGACLLAILARIAQAADHHRQYMTFETGTESEKMAEKMRRA